MILLGSQFTEVVCPEGEPGVYELGAVCCFRVPPGRRRRME